MELLASLPCLSWYPVVCLAWVMLGISKYNHGTQVSSKTGNFFPVRALCLAITEWKNIMKKQNIFVYTAGLEILWGCCCLGQELSNEKAHSFSEIWRCVKWNMLNTKISLKSMLMKHFVSLWAFCISRIYSYDFFPLFPSPAVKSEVSGATTCSFVLLLFQLFKNKKKHPISMDVI